MSKKYPGGFINAIAPVPVGPVDGEGGSAPGVWTIDQANYWIKQGQWPLPIIPKYLQSWGLNANGQLGLGSTTNYSSPMQVGSLTTWANIAAGFFHSMAVKTDGTLWSWGRNDSGCLGLGNTTYYSSPKQVGALNNWSSVAAARGFGFAIKTNGTLWAIGGRNSAGQLGLNNTTAYYSSPKQVGALSTWASIACGDSYSIATRTDGTLWAWGLNGSGQLGTGNITYYSSPRQIGALTNWYKIASANTTSIAIKTDGTIWAWGANTNGQLGLNNRTNYSSPKQIGALTNWSTCGAGNQHVMATKTDGTLWTWGSNFAGQLGLGNVTYYSSPKQVGSLTNWSKVLGSAGNFTGAIKSNRTLWTWGQNSTGQLGLGNRTYYSSPKQVGVLTTWSTITGRNAQILGIG